MAAMFVAGSKIWEKFFTPLSLFTNGEQGAWFDAGDLETVYPLARGGVTASSGSPIGLILDKSKPVSETNLFNGFTSIGSWTDNGNGSWSIDAQAIGRTMNGDSTFTVPAGVYLEWTFNLMGGPVFFYPKHSTPVTRYAGDQRVVSITNNQFVRYATNPGTAATIGDITIRQVPGNHASQGTSAARPTLMQSGAVRYLYRDPVDDALPWTAPAGSYDIVHIPLTGPATVLTEQALSGSTNILLAENTRAYLAINRRLTAAETAALAAYYGASA